MMAPLPCSHLLQLKLHAAPHTAKVDSHHPVVVSPGSIGSLCEDILNATRQRHRGVARESATENVERGTSLHISPFELHCAKGRRPIAQQRDSVVIPSYQCFLARSPHAAIFLARH